MTKRDPLQEPLKKARDILDAVKHASLSTDEHTPQLVETYLSHLEKTIQAIQAFYKKIGGDSPNTPLPEETQTLISEARQIETSIRKGAKESAPANKSGAQAKQKRKKLFKPLGGHQDWRPM